VAGFIGYSLVWWKGGWLAGFAVSSASNKQVVIISAWPRIK